MFNIADSSITVGVFIILIFQGVFFKDGKKKEENVIKQTLPEETTEDFIQTSAEQ